MKLPEISFRLKIIDCNYYLIYADFNFLDLPFLIENIELKYPFTCTYNGNIPK